MGVCAVGVAVVDCKEGWGGGERNSNRATGYNSAPVTLRPGQVHPAIKDRGVGCQGVRGGW